MIFGNREKMLDKSNLKLSHLKKRPKKRNLICMKDHVLFTISEFVLDEKFPKEISKFIIFGKHQVKMLKKEQYQTVKPKNNTPKIRNVI